MRVLKKLLWAYLALIAVLLLLGALFQAFGQRDLGLPTSGSGSELIVTDIPKDFNERAAAPALALLPNRIADDPQAGTEQIDRAEIEALLAKWESFTPRQAARAKYLGRPDPYRQAVEQISSEGQDALYRRVDSTDPPGVCPLISCQAGLRWVPGSFGGMKIRDLQAEQAYVTGYGLVEYQGQSTNPYQGKNYYRSYGLLLARVDGSWTLTRAAAETLSAL